MKVEFLDADSGVFIHEQDLTFDPRLSPLIEITNRGEAYGATLYEVVVAKSRMRLAVKEPSKSSLVVFLRRTEQ
jgi:hypothetical protein